MFDFKLGNWSGLPININVNLTNRQDSLLNELCRDLISILPTEEFFTSRKNNIKCIGNVNKKIQSLKSMHEAQSVYKNIENNEISKEIKTLQKYQVLVIDMHDKMQAFIYNDKNKNIFTLYRLANLQIACQNYLIELENELKTDIGINDEVYYQWKKIIEEIRKALQI